MSTKTPLEHWRTLTRNLSSPDIFVEAGFYALVAAALQRRVWKGALDEGPLFPNIFLLFVAPPGVAGKGLVTGTIYQILERLLFVPKDAKGNVLEEHVKLLAERAAKEGRRELLIPVAPQNITFEKLCQNLATAVRVVHAQPPYPRGQKGPIYQHRSLFFNLDELKSFIDEDAKRTVTFLQTMYNCSYYDKETKKNGDDRMEACCLNIIAGTQPDTFQELVRKVRIQEQGLTSRFFILYADKERQRMAFKDPYDSEQLESLEFLMKFVEKLATYYGPVTDTAEARDFFMSYWSTESDTRVNKSPLIADYYTRKNQHAPKMAMIIAFSELIDKDVDGTYKLERRHYVEALSILDRWERDRHRAFKTEGLNKVGSMADNVVEALRKQPAGMGFVALLHTFHKDLKREELSELLTDLKELGKISTEIVKGNVNYKLT